jgi:hypothetical protein
VLERGSKYAAVGTAANGQAHSLWNIMMANKTKVTSKINVPITNSVALGVTTTVDYQ